MSRSSGDRGTATPFGALVAVVAVGIGLSLYATVVTEVPTTDDRDVATPTLRAVHDGIAPGGVVDPNLLSAGRDVAPAGYHVAITLRVANRTWTNGPATKPPDDADTADRPVAVRLGPARVRPGRLRVEVWS
ncbi:hypothetical protein BRD17_00430 [Halobacteriales archaeon SW_7_68_16]|nr:MAG: hypothetical protein BRD17_00430 [Halobacteriales archaeon SW_7_68_16]